MAKASPRKKKNKKSPSQNEKAHQRPVLSTAVGLTLLFVAVFMAGAFASFLLNWQSDQSEASRGFLELLGSNDIRVQNVFGRLGALLGHHLVYRGLGVGAFVLCYAGFFFGLRLALKVKLLHWPRRLLTQLFLLLWIPVALAFTVKPWPILAGAVGYYSEQWLHGILGGVGTALFLLFSFLILMALRFGWTPTTLRHFFGRAQQQWQRLLQVAKPSGKWTDEAENEAPFAEAQKQNEKEVESRENEENNSAEHEKAPESTFEIIAPEEEEPQLKAVKGDNGEETDPETNTGATADTELEIEQTEEEAALSEKEVKKHREDFGEYDPTLDLSRFKLPTIDLLKDYGSSNFTINQKELEANKNRIIETLNNYKIDIASIKATIGPTVTLYEIVPAAGVRISKIKNLEDDIALSLSALGIRIIAPIPGRGTIGIEVPNTNPKMVPMRNLLMGEKFQQTDMELPIAFGKTISNETWLTDLAKMPHLLMAGATGQGKSVGLNVILTSLLYKKHPSQVKFILVDPKKVELTLFNKIERHYLAKLPDTEEAIITDNQKVINTLNSLCIEMDDRYNLLKDAFCRNIKEYNHKFVNRKLNPNEGHRYLPYIVLVIDEFADLIMTAGKEVETPIARLAQLARAIGIHLIVATQRPSVNVITGVIKANFPARAAFRVSSKIDSRTILDAGGAEQLIGKGDMLFHMGQDLVRLQCAFVDTPEVERITDYIGSQQAYPEAYKLPEYVGEEEGGGAKDIDASERDSMFEDAARLLVTHQQGSTSLLQRKLKLGYNRAGRIIDQLEAAGIIGPFEGSKARQVLITDEHSLEQLLEQERNNN